MVTMTRADPTLISLPLAVRWALLRYPLSCPCSATTSGKAAENEPNNTTTIPKMKENALINWNCNIGLSCHLTKKMKLCYALWKCVAAVEVVAAVVAAATATTLQHFQWCEMMIYHYLKTVRHSFTVCS